MEIKVGDRISDVELVSKEDNQVRILIDGVLFELDIVTSQNGVFSILHNGRSYNAELIRSENGREYTVNTYFSSFPVEIIDPQLQYRRSLKKEGEGDTGNLVVSQMPGKVVKILVSEGEKVAARQSVVIVEAMKMQNEYKVARDCVIGKIRVQEGDSVAGGQTLLTLE